MNILRSAWGTSYDRLATVVHTVVAMALGPLLAYLAERNRCRVISDLESLPSTILRDIGIRRADIPFVVTKAMQEHADGAAGASESQRPAQGDASRTGDRVDPASTSSAA